MFQAPMPSSTIQTWFNNVGTGKKGNKCYRIYYLADFFHPVKDIGIVDFMNKNEKMSESQTKAGNQEKL